MNQSRVLTTGAAAVPTAAVEVAAAATVVVEAAAAATAAVEAEAAEADKKDIKHPRLEIHPATLYTTGVSLAIDERNVAHSIKGDI
jgi:hypothetical protein